MERTESERAAASTWMNKALRLCQPGGAFYQYPQDLPLKDWQQDTLLCNRCLSLLLAIARSEPVQSLELYHSQFTARPSACPICRRAYSAFLKERELDDQSYWNWQWTTRGWVGEDLPGGGDPQRHVRVQASRGHQHLTLCSFSMNSGLSHEGSLQQLDMFVDDSQLNLEFAQSRLKDCLRNHAFCHDGRRQWWPERLLHIDGYEARGMRGVQYVALLGNASPAKLISLVQDLGFEYYWVGGRDKDAIVHATLVIEASHDELDHERDVAAEIGFTADLSFLKESSFFEKELSVVWLDACDDTVSARSPRPELSQRFLASRVLTIGLKRLIWKCDMVANTEVSELHWTHNLGRNIIPNGGQRLTDEWERITFLESWYHTVRNVSCYGGWIEDIADQLSGMMGRYIHGHWEQDLFRQLAWTFRGAAEPATVPADVPSWSWMAGGSNVHFNDDSYCRYLHMGEVLNLEPLRIRGCLIEVDERLPMVKDSPYSPWKSDTGETYQVGDMFMVHSFVDEDRDIMIMFIALKKVEEGVYRRIGLQRQQVWNDDPILQRLLEFDELDEEDTIWLPTAKPRQELWQEFVLV